MLNSPPHLITELIDGKLYTRPRTPQLLFIRSALQNELSQHIGMETGRVDDWWILYAPKIRFSEEKEPVIPNIAGWKKARVPERPTEPYTLAPDWVCEELPTTTETNYRAQIKDVYARAGISHLWILDPDARSLEAFERFGTQWVLIDKLFDSALVSLPPFEAIRFNLGNLWRPSGPQRYTKSSKKD